MQLIRGSINGSIGLFPKRYIICFCYHCCIVTSSVIFSYASPSSFSYVTVMEESVESGFDLTEEEKRALKQIDLFRLRRVILPLAVLWIPMAPSSTKSMYNTLLMAMVIRQLHRHHLPPKPAKALKSACSRMTMISSSKDYQTFTHPHQHTEIGTLESPRSALLSHFCFSLSYRR